MNKTLTITIIALIVIISTFLYNDQIDNETQVCFEDKCFNVEVADNQMEREKGLMYRDRLGESEGMLFIFDSSAKYNFWMKNTLIPLDIIWISRELKVVDIKEAMPCKTQECETFSPTGAALYVLEINGGESKKLGIKVGDSVRLESN